MLRAAAAAAAGHQSHPGATLYLVATPIGNRADITLRALHVLGRADTVACEDTRVTAQLLAHYGLEGKALLAVHAHNENEAAARVCDRLAEGEVVAFVSDAGTPGVSDPGARLVAAAVAAGFRVVPIPGASSTLAALSVAGDVVATGFVFRGFLPAKGAERQAAVQAVVADGQAQVLFEAPHRIESLLAALALAGERVLTLGRELTKQFETVVTLSAADAPGWLAADANRSRGEFVLVLHAMARAAVADEALSAAAEHCLTVLQRELPLKQAVALAAEISGAPRNALYQRALQRRDDGGH